eukprot:863880_1
MKTTGGKPRLSVIFEKPNVPRQSASYKGKRFRLCFNSKSVTEQLTKLGAIICESFQNADFFVTSTPAEYLQCVSRAARPSSSSSGRRVSGGGALARRMMKQAAAKQSKISGNSMGGECAEAARRGIRMLPLKELQFQLDRLKPIRSRAHAIAHAHFNSTQYPYCALSDSKFECSTEFRIFQPDKHGDPTLPQIYWDNASLGCPFSNPKSNRNKQRLKLKAKESTNASKPENPQVPPGFCENCQLHFDDLEKHVNVTKHKIRVAKEERYNELDAFFVQIDLNQVKKRKEVEEKVRNKEKEEVKTEVDIAKSAAVSSKSEISAVLSSSKLRNVVQSPNPEALTAESPAQHRKLDFSPLSPKFPVNSDIPNAVNEDTGVSSAHGNQLAVSLAHRNQTAVSSAYEKQAVVSSAHGKQATVSSAHGNQPTVSSEHVNQTAVSSAHENQTAVSSAHENQPTVSSANEKQPVISSAHTKQLPGSTVDKSCRSPVNTSVAPQRQPVSVGKIVESVQSLPVEMDKLSVNIVSSGSPKLSTQELKSESAACQLQLAACQSPPAAYESTAACPTDVLQPTAVGAKSTASSEHLVADIVRAPAVVNSTAEICRSPKPSKVARNSPIHTRQEQPFEKQSAEKQPIEKQPAEKQLSIKQSFEKQPIEKQSQKRSPVVTRHRRLSMTATDSNSIVNSVCSEKLPSKLKTDKSATKHS